MHAAEVALQVVSGSSHYYPLSHVQNETRLLRSLISSTGATGTSVLIQGPEPIILSAMVQQVLVQTSPETCTVYLHGMTFSDSSPLLSQICSALSFAHRHLSTFDELGCLLGDWFREHPSQKILIVLHAFERFAAAFQNFLYTVFELTSSCPLDVVALTCHTDVVDMLEKRVKSRFSQNIICVSHPKNFDTYLGFIKLTLEGVSVAAPSKKYLQSVKRALSDAQISSYLERLYEEDHDPMRGIRIFVDALACAYLKGPSAELRINYILDRITTHPKIPSTITLPELCTAEWCALIALKRAQSKTPDTAINFEVLYEEYSHGFAVSASSNEAPMIARKFSQTVIRSAVDMLVNRGILAVANRTRQLESIETRQELQARIPLSQLTEWLNQDETCPAVLKKLACEAL